MILLFGFTFKCWIGKTGLGAETLVYCFEKGVGYTGFIISAGGEAGFGVTLSSYKKLAAAIFSLSERSIRMSGYRTLSSSATTFKFLANSSFSAS